ncbi:MAG: hypothetical protein GY896_23005 [Gammaproteobacteria bacterium]|nr:hypothetical protein [Gammaproteobacteria bacterium]
MSDQAHQLPEAQAPLGDKLDTELVSVSSVNVLRQRIQLAGANELERASVSNAALAIDAYGLAVRALANRSSLQTFVSAVTFNNVTTQDLSSTEFACGPYKKAILYVDATIVGNPTALNIGFEFADVFTSPVSADWHLHLAERVRVTDFSIQRFALDVDSPGQLARTRLDSEGTTAIDTITATITVEFFS